MASSGNDLPCVTIWLWLHKTCGRAPILRILFAALVAFAVLTPASASPPSSGMRRRPTIRYFIATAYSVEGTGASGKWSHPGTVAADRKVLPLNSRIRVYGAGRYSGDYTVRHWWEGGRPPHRRLHAQPCRSKKVWPSTGEGGRPEVWRRWGKSTQIGRAHV